jgi:hypothetical protein
MAETLNPPVPMNSEQTQDIDYTPDNPQPESAQERLDARIAPEDRDMLVQLITTYRTGWAPDRLLRIPDWTRNILFRRGRQTLAWDPQNNCYFDYLDWYRSSGQMQDGDDDRLERFVNNITKKACTGFVATVSRGVPPTAVSPEDAEIEADLATARFGQQAISIIERENDINGLVREEATTLFDGGMYAKHTRVTLDGAWGYELEPEFAEVTVSQSDRYHCPMCGEDAPATGDAFPPKCRCGKQLSSGDFYPGEDQQFDGVVGVKKKPRAMVKWSIHGPLEFDADPTAKYLEESAIKCIVREIDIGAARQAFPSFASKIMEGATTSTSPNDEYERYRRNEAVSQAYAFTSDSYMERVTYLQVWMEPKSYYRMDCARDEETPDSFVERMMKLGPEGLKVTIIGSEVVDVRPCRPCDELSVCLLHEGCGLYPPSIGEDVVSFNERLNNTMNIIDDYFEHCAAGVTVADANAFDREEMRGKTMMPGEFNWLSRKGTGDGRPLGDFLYQFKYSLDQNIILYPSQLIQLNDNITGITAQLTGTGTQKGVETLGGQQLQVNLSEAMLNTYWEQMKGEHARASLNAIKALQKAHEEGLINELWEVIESDDSEFRNGYVDLSKINGRVRVYPVIDEGLPQSPEAKREMYRLIFSEYGKGNQAAVELMSVPTNQEIVMKAMVGQEMVLPTEKQRERTMQHINILLKSPGHALIDGNTGQLVQQLPAKPKIGVDDFVTAKATLKLFRQENEIDLEHSNPEGLMRLDAYYQMLEELDAQEMAQKAQRQSKVNEAGHPSDPTMMQARAALIKDAQAAIERNAAIGGENPELLAAGKLLSPVVNANKSIIDSAMKAVQ